MSVAIASSASATPGAASTIVIPAPSGITTGDLLAAWLSCDGTDEIDPDTGGPSGWTNLSYDRMGDNDGNIASANVTCCLWIKRAVLADESATDYTWTLGSSEYGFGHIMRLTGDDANKWLAAGWIEQGVSAAPNFASVYFPKGNGIAFAFIGNDRDRGTPGTPAGYSVQYATSAGGSGGAGIGVFTKTISALGMVQPGDSSLSNSDEFGTMTLVIREDESALSGSDLDYAQGVFTTSTDGSDTVVSGLGFTPKALIVWSTLQTSEAVQRRDARHLYGIAASPTDEACAAAYSQDNVGTSNVNRSSSNANLIFCHDAGDSVLLEADLKSWDAGGFTIQWTSYDGSNAYRFHYIAIGGDNIVADVVSDALTPSVDDETIAHSLGQAPAIVFAITSGLTSAKGVAGDVASICNGVWVNSVDTTTTSLVIAMDVDVSNYTAWGSEDGQTSQDVAGSSIAGDTYSIYTTLLGQADRGSIEGVDASNIKLTKSAGTTAGYVHYLLIGGLRATLGDNNTLRSDAGTDLTGFRETAPQPVEPECYFGPAAIETSFSSGIDCHGLITCDGVNVAGTNIAGVDNSATMVHLAVNDTNEIKTLRYYLPQAANTHEFNLLDSTGLTTDYVSGGYTAALKPGLFLQGNPTAAAEGEDVTCTLETLSFTSYNASINVKKQIDATLETLSLTAYNTTVEITDDVNVTCTLETLSFTSYNTTVEAKNQVDATLETLSFTAYNSTVNAKTQVACTLESLSLTAYSAEIKLNQTVACTLESLSLTAYNATIEAKNQVDATLETLSFTAYQTSVVVGISIVCTLETLSFTSYDTTVQADNELDLSLGALTLTPYTAALNVKQQVAASLGSLSFAAYAAEVKLNVNVVSTLEQLILTKYDTTVEVVPGGFFRNMKGNLDGLGSGGPFFKNPLG